MNRSVVVEGRPFEITALVENPTASPTSVVARLSLFGEVVESRTVRVPADGQRRVRFVRRIEAPGTYTPAVNGRTTEVVVEDDGEAEPRPIVGADSSSSAPGMLEFPGTSVVGALASVALLLGVVLLLATGFRRGR